MLHYAQFYETNKDEFPGFWHYRYGVAKPQRLLDSLLDRGFLTLSSNTYTLQKMKIPEIQKILKANNLIQTGKKEILIARLMENLAENDLRTQLPFFVMYEHQKEKMNYKKHKYYIKIHNDSHNSLNIWTANTLQHENPSRSFADKYWGFLNRKGVEALSNNHYGFFSVTCKEKGQLLIEENQLKAALNHFLVACYILLNGLRNNFILKDSDFKFFFPYENSGLKLPPSFATQLKKIVEDLQMTPEELENLFYSAIAPYAPLVPFRVFTDAECIQILLYEITGLYSENEILGIFADAENRLKETY